MFRTLSGGADPLECSDAKGNKRDHASGANETGESTESDREAIHRVPCNDGAEEHEEDTLEEKEKKQSRRPSAELTRTTSNALSRVSSRLTTRSLPDPGPPPDGGLKAWTQIAMGWIAIVTTWGWINCFGVFQTYYTLHLEGVSPSSISWIGTTQTFLTFTLGAVSGRLLDAGFFFPIVVAGIFLQVLSIFMMSLSTKYWQLFLTQGLLCGIGGGLFFTPCIGVTATWFSKRRSFAMGIASTGNSFGGMIYPIITRALLPKIGFAWTVRVLGFINMGLLALVIAFMRPRLPPRKSDALIDWSAFKELPFVVFLGALFFQMWDIYFTLYYVSSYGVEALGLPFVRSTILLIIVNGIGVPARLIPGYIADRIGQLNLMVPFSWSLTIIAWSWLAVHDIAGLYAFVCLYGLLVGALQCLIPPTTAALTSDLRVIGTRLGMVFAIMGFGALTGPPIGGAIQAAQGGRYIGAQAWAAAATLLCAVGLTIARISKAGWKIWVKA